MARALVFFGLFVWICLDGKIAQVWQFDAIWLLPGADMAWALGSSSAKLWVLLQAGCVSSLGTDSASWVRDSNDIQYSHLLVHELFI